MELGPFSISEVESVKELFESKKVSFEILIDKEAEEQQMAEFNAQATQAPRAMAGRLDLKIVYFEIPDEDFEKVQHGLEKFGIMAMSDGSYELGED
ncbi:MAG: hypothetical protein V4596_08585 [Bdellovibrionota bacterium]